ncbi:disulfide bond formation protein B [Oleiagrimonas soli]|uniref:Disulfide bond formation protein B n=1 Tax=Oleiagrimonas soli TaxID=1543381 RepID=A0A099CUL7_9GAMM|nr:disulfide bond formation protein B [Oleiagrimonas soli]KGI77381.1 disulfide bond formation protein B [Oleiagrimonas soli]MBB6182684.1 disulfide bond formation protein DsbB [Oleiagrimonas soli]
MNPLRWSFRTFYLVGFLICAALIGFALYAQYVLLMDPCPLCILQRVAFIALGMVFLVGGLHAPKGHGRWVYALLALLAAATGVAIAARHLWIQSLPPGAVPSCGAPLGYLLDTRDAHGGLLGVLKMVLSGSGECAKVENILGLPMPLWSLIWFVLLGAGALFAARRRR